MLFLKPGSVLGSRRGLPVFACRIRPVAGIYDKEHVMGVNKDQVKGRVKEAEGKIKEAVGKLVGNQKLATKGKVQKIAGDAQARYGDMKKNVQDSIKRK